VNPLRRLHSDRLYASRLYRISLEYWRTRSTQEIVDSLADGNPEPLVAKDDGTVMQGNTRIKVLEERGYDVDGLPRVPYE
jgi:hypothetical protein